MTLKYIQVIAIAALG